MEFGNLEEMIASTIASDEDAKIHVFDLEPDDFKGNRIAYEVIRRMKEDPKMDIYDLGAQMFDEFGKAYNGFLDKAGLSIQIEEWIRMLKEKKARKKVELISHMIIEKAQNEKIEDLRVLLLDAENAIDLKTSLDYEKMSKVAKTVVSNSMDLWENLLTVTPLPLVGDMVTPMYGGEEIVIAGRPGMGKTTFMLELAFRLAQKKQKVGFISLEMDSEQLTQRMCQRYVDISLRNYLPYLNKYSDQKKKFLDGMSYLKDLPIFFDDNTSRSLGGLLLTIEKMAKIEGVKIFFIDYMQLIAPPKKASRNDEVAAISRALKLLALRNRITVIVASQLNRSVERQENKKPHLADLRDSGAIEQDADVVAFLYRAGYYDYKRNPEEVEFIVSKQRSGIVGSKKLIFKLDKQMFMEVKNE